MDPTITLFSTLARFNEGSPTSSRQHRAAKDSFRLMTKIPFILLALVAGYPLQGFALDRDTGSIILLANVSEALRRSSKPFKTVGLKCPAENSGILEQVRKNADQYVTKNRFKFVGDRVTKVILEAAEPGKGFEVINRFDIEKPAGDASQAAGQAAVAEIMPLYSQLCSDPVALRKFKEQMHVANQGLSRLDKAAEPREAEQNLLRRAILKSQSPFKTIGLRCPSSNLRSLEQIRRNKEKIVSRSIYQFENGRVSKIEFQAAFDGSDFLTIEQYDLSAPKGDLERKDGEEAARNIMSTVENVCNAPENWDRYNALMLQNRASFGHVNESHPRWDRHLMELR
ncbi:hypothetical protein [Methylobacterium radiotolerans]